MRLRTRRRGPDGGSADPWALLARPRVCVLIVVRRRLVVGRGPPCGSCLPPPVGREYRRAASGRKAQRELERRRQRLAVTHAPAAVRVCGPAGGAGARARRWQAGRGARRAAQGPRACKWSKQREVPWPAGVGTTETRRWWWERGWERRGSRALERGCYSTRRRAARPRPLARPSPAPVHPFCASYATHFQLGRL
jgi:hypothetical protein